METNTPKKLFLYAGFLLIACIATSVSTAGQTPSPSPAASSGSSSVTNIGGFDITSSVEIGLRGLDVNGDHDKYRSDLNYGPGLRVFDSSFLMENTSGGRNPFDSLLVQTSGWGGDPNGSFRLNVDRTGLYKFDSNIRKVRYYNNLKTHVVNFGQPVSTGSEHRANTLHHFGDFDLTIFPERDLRFRVGYSFNDTEGPGTSTLRFSSDEYMIDSTVKSRSDDIRLGVEGKLLGFNWGVNYGRRNFRDKTQFFNNGLNAGNNTATTTSFMTYANRQFDVKGTTDFVHGYVQRTFARRLDFTGRLIYSESRSDIHENDFLQGRASNGNIITSDVIDVFPANAKRPQTRADLGVTYRVTDRFRISNTYTFDQYNISGSHLFYELLQSTTAAGGPVSPTLTRSSAWRGTSYRRISNLVEGDYQFSRRFSFNLGYRYTNREVTVGLYDVNLLTGAIQRSGEEDLENSTHTFIAGARFKPTNNWTVYVDLENGASDNVFTRLANNDYFNFRVRSVANVKNVTFNLSFITKDNEDNGMATTTVTPPVSETVADTDIRIFAGSVDWAPRHDLSFSAGYTYTYQTSRADVIVPVGTPIITPSTQFLLGSSEYYVRDNHFFFDITAHPLKRLSIYAHYSIDDDGGQGSRLVTRPQDIISSYPMTFQTPEIKLAIRLTRNIDWNVGYQYYSYDEVPPVFPFATPQVRFPAQNYSAHMPYTSLRFYFGKGADDR